LDVVRTVSEPVVTFRAVTFALTTRAPVESVTVPSIVPVPPNCAIAQEGATKAMTKSINNFCPRPRTKPVVSPVDAFL
jgi:hypothetical protein